jgi:ATP-binding cassette subfamily B protein
MPFEKVVAIKQLGFRYSPSHSWVLRNLSLDIPKGSRVGFVGATGSGKSTLLDVVMGLLTPTEGELLVDGKVLTELNTRAWQAHISHVPQAIFLSDTTIAENVAFGVAPELIDMQRVRQAAEKAQIAQTIESWSSGYKTIVGERGIRLSGGQRQSIGIARALYKRADVIVFDEATSALDNDTEEAVMRAIETLGPDVTVLIIAHRLTTLKKCDFVVELKKGAIHTSTWYDQVKLQAR